MLNSMGRICITTIITVVFSITTAQSQTLIHGKVLSTRGEALPFVNLFIKGSFEGSSSDNNGYYAFKTRAKGEIILTASFIGYKTVEKVIIADTDSIRVDIILSLLTTSINEITINAGSIEASDENRDVALKAMDIGTIAGATGDIMLAMESLPGTQHNGESDGLFVRGGSGHESKIIFDEMVVQNPYYSPVPDIRQRGRFDPFMFSGTVFSTGGYSARYGQALSSVLILKSRGLADSTNTGGGIHFYGARLFHTERWENSSLHADISYNNMKMYHNLFNIDRYIKSPENLCGQLIFRQRLSRDALFKLYANISNTQMVTDLETFSDSLNHSTFDLNNSNTYINSSYKRYYNNEEWSLFSGISFSDDRDKVLLDTLNMAEREQLLQSKVILTNNSIPFLDISSGCEFQYLLLRRAYRGILTDTEGLLFAGFTEAMFQASDRFALKLGLRYEYSGLIEDQYIAPRISAAYIINPHNQVSFAYGSFCQYPHNEYLIESGGPLLFEAARHYILNYQWNRGEKLFRLELYNKDYNNLIRIDSESGSLSNTGYGNARGMEIFWHDKETIPGASYWISYSYLDTRRLYLDFPIEAPPAFTSRHNLNIVYRHWIPVISCMAGSSLNYASGRPYFNPYRATGEFNSDLTPYYSSLDFNVSWMCSIFKRRSVAYLSITNLLGRDNIFGYKYYDELNRAIPVKPVSRRSVFFGFFISTY